MPSTTTRTNAGSVPNAGQTAAAAELPAALMTMTLHMVESRIALMGELARCSTVVDAQATMARWMDQRVTEFGEDQARLAEAVINSFAQGVETATKAMTAANGLAAGIENAAKAGTQH